ncbi:MAG TPA: RNA-binding protein, partial [Thermoanaerobaculia bacterium]|nr:RNA-binding protein [Thermoanaerobaculia bacterium]
MSKRLYVGNLPPGTTAAEVRAAFSRFGEVTSVDLATDRFTGHPRDFGYVEMDEGAAAAIAGLNR